MLTIISLPVVVEVADTGLGLDVGVSVGEGIGEGIALGTTTSIWVTKATGDDQYQMAMRAGKGGASVPLRGDLTVFKAYSTIVATL